MTKTKVVLTLSALMAVPAYAQFGGIVSDPGAYVRMSYELSQLVQEYQAIMQVYQMSMQTYANLDRAAHNITNKTVWMPGTTDWSFPSAANTYGSSGPWVQAANTGAGSVPGYTMATIPATSYGSVMSNLSTVRQGQVGSHYASMELYDAAIINALTQSGKIRAQSGRTDAAIANFARDSSSLNPEMNTQVGVLNQISAGAVIQAQQQQNTNQMLTTMMDQQAVAAKLQRDAIAQSFNDDVAQQISAPANRDAVWNGTTAAHYARLP